MSEDSDSDFYGFAADSFLYDGSRLDWHSNQEAGLPGTSSRDVELPGTSGQDAELPGTSGELRLGSTQRSIEDINSDGNHDSVPDLIVNRRSKRKAKRPRLSDYVYY